MSGWPSLRRGGRLLAALFGVIALGAAGEEQADLGLVDFRQGRFAEAFQDWRQAAAAGDARGALYLGVLYDAGLGVTQDYHQAMAWYCRASDAGSAVGAFNVGVMYDAGLGVPQDPRQAAAWYALAASRKLGRADYNLALMYEAGSGVSRSPARARALFRRAAQAGISAAQTHLAALGQPFRGAVSGQQDSAMQAFQQAQQLLLSRGPGDAARMAALFRRAAAAGNALAEYDLGYCYEHGLGVAADPAEAIAWYRRAAGDADNGALRDMARTGAGTLQSRLK